MSEHNLILEFYKPTYNLDFDYDGDGGLDLHFTNIKGEFFMTMNDSYNSVYIEDEDCEFSKGEMFATVDLGDLVERIINGEFRQTNGKAVSDWGKRFIGDGEEQIEFNGKNYADGSLFWDDFFKEMPKDEIKDFMTFCEDYLDLPNIEVDTVSNKYDFENGEVELKSNGKWGITVNDDYTIISVDKFTCNSTDACDAYDVASSELDGDDYYESKKSARKSLKEEKATDSLFEDVVFSMIKKFKLKKEYDVERPSWTVFNFRHKNKDAQFAITFDERGYGDFLYGEVLAFGDEKDDIFKYKTDEVKINSYDIEKECSNIINDCLIFINTNKKITIFESKKSVKRSLKEGFNDELIATSYDGETTLYLSDERQANHGKDPHYEFKLGENGYFTRYIRCDDNRCENVVLDWIKEFDLDISKSEISKIIKLHESKKSARKNSLKEEAMTTKLFRFVQDLYDLHYITEEQLNKFQTHDFSKKEIKVLEHNYEIYKTSNEFDEINNAIKLTVNMINSFTESLKEYLVKGLDVDFVVDHLLSLEDLDNIDLINKLGDLWEVYKKSWSKFNKSLSDFWKVMKNIEKLDSFDDTCKEIIDAWYDDIEKIFYSNDNLENLKLIYGFEGNDIF